MRIGFCKERAVFRADNFDFSGVADIMGFFILVYVPVHLPGSANKDFCIDERPSTARRAAVSLQMLSRSLPEVTVFFAADDYGGMGVDIFHFCVIVAAPVFSACIADELFVGFP